MAVKILLSSTHYDLVFDRQWRLFCDRFFHDCNFIGVSRYNPYTSESICRSVDPISSKEEHK